MQILHERMKKMGIDNQLYLRDDSLCLKGVRLYESGQATKREFVYLVFNEAFLILKVPKELLYFRTLWGRSAFPLGVPEL